MTAMFNYLIVVLMFIVGVNSYYKLGGGMYGGGGMGGYGGAHGGIHTPNGWKR
ncbi:unnamed protein product [Cylicocyclus nassatus]|uniref:Uncharacterized protein n=1 Tax=Cylicocyclus nassatus TaxID=53992 RepID=A0AA36DJ47_CYLNA|nr:unnamed protein product [Cylicocyclus nassatus]